MTVDTQDQTPAEEQQATLEQCNAQLFRSLFPHSHGSKDDVAIQKLNEAQAIADKKAADKANAEAAAKLTAELHARALADAKAAAETETEAPTPKGE